MQSALRYCSNRYKKTLAMLPKNQAVFKAFKTLEEEINQLDLKAQLHLYAFTTQFLESLVCDKKDRVNPLEVFVLQCNSITANQNDTLRKVGLALGVIAISLSVLLAGVGMGVGIGMLLGLWQTPALFMTGLFAAEAAPLGVASFGVSLGVGAGLLSRYLFFKEPQIKHSLEHCVEAVKQSYLSPIEEPKEQACESHEVLASPDLNVTQEANTTLH